MRFPFARSILILTRRLGTLWVLALALTAIFAGGSRHDQLVFRVAFTACAVLICVLSWKFRGRNLSPWLGSLELVACNLAIFLALGEGSLRLLSAHSSNALLVPNALDSFRLEPGRDYGAGLRGNRFGYPGPDHDLHRPSGSFRIAALGDSFAIGPAVAFEDNYLTRLERIIPGAEVLNFGVAGTGPREYLEILHAHALAFDPDLVLVSFFVGNDVTESLAVPRGLDPHQFSLYLALHRGLRILHRSSQQHGITDRLAGAQFSEDQFLEIEARRLEVCRTPVREALEKKWDRALNRLKAITQTCAAARARCAVILIPDEFQVNKQVLEAARTRAGMAEQDLNLELPQTRVRELLTGNETPCLDLLPVFRKNPDTYAPRDTHWNASGNHLAAQEIARWLTTEGLAPVSRLASAPPPPIP